MAFSAPVTEQAFVLKHIVGIEALSQHERFADATPDMVQAIVEGMAPLPRANLPRSTG